MFEKILMPSDGSGYALRAAEYGADVARKYGSAVTIIYVAELPPVIGIPPSPEHREETRQVLGELGNRALDETKAVFQGIEARTELLYGSAVPTILKYVREDSYDLLVMGSRGAGSGAIGQILIGSVAEGLLHGTPCPILMIRG
ncbi:MAG: universal stress protein [Armatimonadota bacterium]